MDPLSHKKQIALNIIKSFVESKKDNIPVYSEAEFQKAQEEGLIEVFSVDAISACYRTVQRMENTARTEIDFAEIEKAKKDLSKLVKVKKQDSRGRMITYYVRSSSKENSNLKKPAKSEENMHDTGLSGIHVPKQMTHAGLGELKHKRDEEGEGENHKHYYEDKDGHEVHFTSGTLLQHGMASKQASGVHKFEKHEEDINTEHGKYKFEVIKGKRNRYISVLSPHGSDEAIFEEHKNKSAAHAWKDEALKYYKNIGQKETKPDYSAVKEWVGDDYTDEQIHSVYEAFGGEDELNKKFKPKERFKSQAAESAHIYNVIDALGNQAQKRPSGISKEALNEILWGIGMNAQNK